MFGSLKRSPRLGHWNGRPHRHRRRKTLFPVPGLKDRIARARVGLIVGTALLFTVAATILAPTIPFRSGEISPRDIRARVAFTVVNEAQTEQRREQLLDGGQDRVTVAPVVDRYSAGTPLVKR